MGLVGRFTDQWPEAGCDEAGRGCLAGPVFAAAVIWPDELDHPYLKDSKKLHEQHRQEARTFIESHAIAWAVCSVAPAEIDRLNILWASVKAMQLAALKLSPKPAMLLVDGNRFKPLKGYQHTCVIKGDDRVKSIAAASILAKTYRDEYMLQAHAKYPDYRWDENKGYPTQAHRAAIIQFGITPEHRRSFGPVARQLDLFTS